MKLPNVWGQGSLFAFSGLDGECTYENSMVGTLCGDKIGINFHTKVRRELSFLLHDINDIHYEIVASDIISVLLEKKETGEKVPLILMFSSQHTIIGLTSLWAMPVIYCEEAQKTKLDNITLHKTDGEYTAFASDERDGLVRFSFSFSIESTDDVITKVKHALSLDIGETLSGKMEFYNRLPQIDGLSDEIERTFFKCFSVLKSQVYSPEGMFKTKWTTPDRLPHKNLWLWDSVFHSIGNKYISEDLAYESIKAVLSTQKEDGFIAQMSTPYKSIDVTQPPILAWGVYQLYEYNGDINILLETYDKLKKYLLWNVENRDSNKNFLFEWVIYKDSVDCRCGECGMDNSPRFDNVVEMDCIDFSCFMANEARHMAKIALVLGFENENKYWLELFKVIKKAVNEKLWDDSDKYYFDRILEDGAFKKVKAVSSFLPLFAGICDEKHARELVKHLLDEKSFNTAVPIPSISVDDKTFGTDMWRGPVWVNYNYMIASGLREYGYNELAEKVIEKTVNAISFWYCHDGVVYEFYDSMNSVSPRRLNRKGKPVEPCDFRIRTQNIKDYGWSCALFVAMIMESY